MLFDIVLFIFVLSFLVVIHELGHYLSARIFKVRVEEFGVGYPPRALKLFQRGKTIFSLNWIPFGGFVKMEGEEGADSERVNFEEVGPTSTVSQEAGKKKSIHPDKVEGPFYAKSRLARLVITVAGAAVNFVFGILAFCLFFSMTGIPELAANPRIGQVIEGTPAEAAGLPNLVDVIAVETVDGEVIQTQTVDEVIAAISARPNQAITIITTGGCSEIGLECEERAQRFTVTPRPKAEDPSKGEIGIQFLPVVVQKFYPWYEMPLRGTKVGLEQTYYLSQLIIEALGNIGKSAFKGMFPEEVGSPVKIFVESRRAGIFDQGPWILLNYAGIISINLAIFNMLPIPALDGGRVVLILLEYVIGRKRVGYIEGYLNYGGLLILGSFMLIMFAKDIFDVVSK